MLSSIRRLNRPWSADVSIGKVSSFRYYIIPQLAETTNLSRASFAPSRWQNSGDCISHRSSGTESFAKRGNRCARWRFVGAAQSTGPISNSFIHIEIDWITITKNYVKLNNLICDRHRFINSVINQCDQCWKWKQHQTNDTHQPKVNISITTRDHRWRQHIRSHTPPITISITTIIISHKWCICLYIGH